MRFLVEHTSRYSYDVAVALGPHVIRLLPQLPPERLLNRTLLVSPEPIRQEVTIDGNGNTVLEVNFAGTTQELSCISRFEARTIAPSSAKDPGWPNLPWTSLLDQPIAYYYKEVSPEVVAFAEQQAVAANRRPLAFLTGLNQFLYSNSDRHVRLIGNAQKPSDTLRMMSGACRDLTGLFMAACRSQGMAARFVSGYQFAAETPDGDRHLHAWPEVFLPGHGWQGYDPTHGMAVGDGHIALCAAPEQAATMPIEGGFAFSGTVINSTLSYSLRVETHAER